MKPRMELVNLAHDAMDGTDFRFHDITEAGVVLANLSYTATIEMVGEGAAVSIATRAEVVGRLGVCPIDNVYATLALNTIRSFLAGWPAEEPF